jgi:arylsulfatase A-like enzyme
LGVTGNFNLNEKVGMAQGFDHYRDSKAHSFAPGNRLTGKVGVNKAVEMLDGRKEADKARPFYLQLMLVDPHKPILVPPSEFKAFEGEDHKIAPYRAVVKRVDDAIKQLDTKLVERGYTDENTLFVVLADHGEGLAMPEHHGKQHGRLLYHSASHVAWILRGPGVKKGQKVGGMSSQVDVTPTLMGLLGAPIEGEQMAGKDWSAQVRGESDRTDRKMAFSDTWYFVANRAGLFTNDTMCQKDFGTTAGQDTFKIGCFDRNEDPEFTDVKEQAELMGKLVSWREKMEAAYAEWPNTANVEGE